MADAESTLRNVLDLILDERDYSPRDVIVNALTSGGANYTSALFTINVTSPNRDDLKLFAKVACVGEAMRPHMHADWLYNTERFVYTKLAKVYEEIQDENNIPAEYRFVFPKFYGCNNEVGSETVVMENLIESGFRAFDRFKSMDWIHASAAVENLARFHALSFAFEKYRPEEHETIIAGRNSPNYFQQDKTDDASNAAWSQIMENVLDTIKTEQRDTVRQLLLENRYMLKFNKPIGKPVIAHGDYKLSNLLFRSQNDTLQAIAVDYQTVHAGCPAGDLIYFIFLGSDEEFRNRYYAKLLDHYHSSLQQALERLSVDPNVYSRQKFDSDMKELLPYAVLIGVMILPVVTVEAAAAPKVEGDAEVFGFVMKPSDLFAQRFSGIVNDCIRWGAI